MDVQTLIYAYMAVCLSMIIFNCVCILNFKHNDNMILKRSAEFEDWITEQIGFIKDGYETTEEHRIQLLKELKRIGNLVALAETVERLKKVEPEAVREYLVEISPVFLAMAKQYQHKNSIKAAYFCHALKSFEILDEKEFEPIVKILLELLYDSSLYCRENALQAVYSTGDKNYVLQALKIIDSGEHFHHSKLISDGLLEYSGSHKELAAFLLEHFEEFSTTMKVTFLNYFRFSTPDFCEELLPLLMDENQDDEIRFACIRYYGKNYYEPARKLLLSFAQSEGELRWEYAAIASQVLEKYPGERTEEVLKLNLSSSNWYVRYNASETLERFGLTYMELMDIFDNSDRYAREIIQYRLEQRYAKKGAAKK